MFIFHIGYIKVVTYWWNGEEVAITELDPEGMLPIRFMSPFLIFIIVSV